MNPIEIELKSCPFCGGKAKLHTWREEKRRENPSKIKCTVCGASTGVKKTHNQGCRCLEWEGI